VSPVVDLARVLAGDRVAISRAISIVENDSPGARLLLDGLFPKTGRAYRVGITGPPGAGKSTMTSRLARHYRAQGRTVGILAVDPTSPFTGGALLGDRIRMSDVELDTGVFIRSMASRGSLGGLSRKATEAADILDAAGKDIIFLETVGVGQSELDIARAADTTVVVLVPESGDSIQAMKAGLMEIADFFVLNKADRAGADQAVTGIQMILGFRAFGAWNPTVIQAVASEGAGVVEVAQEVEAHRKFLEESGTLRQRRRLRLEDRIAGLVEETVREQLWNEESRSLLKSRAEEALGGTVTPYGAAEALVNLYRRSHR
jgi:LAO/AO transport system kinase